MAKKAEFALDVEELIISSQIAHTRPKEKVVERMGKANNMAKDTLATSQTSGTKEPQSAKEQEGAPKAPQEDASGVEAITMPAIAHTGTPRQWEASDPWER